MNNEQFLNERIQVVCRFSKDMYWPCIPVKFKRSSGREVIVSELGLRHPIQKGTRTIHIFDVTDGQSDYRLEFDSERLTWQLTMEADHV